LFFLLYKNIKKYSIKKETHMNFSKLDEALHILATRGEGVIVAHEQADGKMKYIVSTEAACYTMYSTGAKLHAVNFSCLPEAASRLYIDWEATTKDLYTERNELKDHMKMIRKFIKTVMGMLDNIKINRHVSWRIENRTRLDPELLKWKPSFHIYADLWFSNNYEIMPVFVKEAMNRAKLNCHWIDFGVYQPKSLLRMIGVSSKPYQTLPVAEEDDFSMCITASMSEIPDVTLEHMKQLELKWIPRILEHKQSHDDQSGLIHRILHLLREQGERVTSLVSANTPDTFYGANSVGRNCLTHHGTTHHAGGNRCVVWLNDNRIFYRCLDPEHRGKSLCLGGLLPPI
jgi:hypothetical protein